jgi:hypothetical protein
MVEFDSRPGDVAQRLQEQFIGFGCEIWANRDARKKFLRRCALGGIIGDSDTVREPHERPSCEGG